MLFRLNGKRTVRCDPVFIVQLRDLKIGMKLL